MKNFLCKVMKFLTPATVSFALDIDAAQCIYYCVFDPESSKMICQVLFHFLSGFPNSVKIYLDIFQLTSQKAGMFIQWFQVTHESRGRRTDLR